jgi:chorismate mutase
MKKGGLGGARAEIDRIDAELLRLLNRRAAVVAAIQVLKTRRGEGLYDPARTTAILDRLLRLNKGPLRDEHVIALFTFLLHHFAHGHRPGPLPVSPVLLAELAPGADPGILRRHGLRKAGRRPRKGFVDARDPETRRSKVLLGFLQGAKGAVLRLSAGEDEGDLAALCHRAKLLGLRWRGGLR